MSRLSRLKKATVKFLRQVFHKPKAKISRGSIIIVLALTIIFFVALGLRLQPLLNSQPIVRAFDPWLQLKLTSYITENGISAFFTWYDDSTWVPFGRDVAAGVYLGVPFTTAFFYWFLNAIGISVELIYVAIVLPAFMGALTCMVMFLLGRELHSNSVGLFSALFMAFIPAFMQRTVVGFFDNECIGVFAIVLTSYFFIRSTRKSSMRSAVGAGLSLAYLLGSWGAADFMLGLLALYGFFMLVSGRYSRRLLTSYLITLSLGIFLGGLVPRNGFGNLTSFSMLAPIGVGALLAGYEIWRRIGVYREATASVLAPHMKPILLGLITPVVGAAAYFIFAGNEELTISPFQSNPFVTLGAKFMSVINPFFRLDQRIFASVAEHLPSPWGSFYQTLLVLIFFFPLGMYFLFKRGRDEDWFIFLFGLTTVYFAGSMIRLGLILAPAVSVIGAVAVYSILSPFAKIVTQQSVFERRRFRISSALTSEHAIAAYMIVGLLLSVNVILGADYAANMSNPEFSPGDISKGATLTDWPTAMTYIRNVLPDDAIIASWWDYGYWINGAAGGTTIVDNATWNSTQIAWMGYALMALNLTESLKTFKRWNTTHVLVYWGHGSPAFGGDEGKWPWMVRIAEDRFGSDFIDDATYLSESDQTLEAFYSSTLFKLLAYGEPRTEAEATEMGLPNDRMALDQVIWGNSDYTSHMPVDLHGAFLAPYYSSTYGTVKIYEIDYTMYDQYVNRTHADWVPDLDLLDGGIADGNIAENEREFQNYPVVFGGGYEATVYTRSNSTHMYYGISMDNYTLGQDAFGLQLAPLDSTSRPDIRIVNYDGQEFYDGNVGFDGEWGADSSDLNAIEFGTGDNVIEFIIRLDSQDPQDVFMHSGMNYQLRFLFWNNVLSGEPTLSSDWTSFWVPVDLY